MSELLQSVTRCCIPSPQVVISDGKSLGFYPEIWQRLSHPYPVSMDLMSVNPLSVEALSVDPVAARGAAVLVTHPLLVY